MLVSYGVNSMPYLGIWFADGKNLSFESRCREAVESVCPRQGLYARACFVCMLHDLHSGVSCLCLTEVYKLSHGVYDSSCVCSVSPLQHVQACAYLGVKHSTGRTGEFKAITVSRVAQSSGSLPGSKFLLPILGV